MVSAFQFGHRAFQQCLGCEPDRPFPGFPVVYGRIIVPRRKEAELRGHDVLAGGVTPSAGDRGALNDHRCDGTLPEVLLVAGFMVNCHGDAGQIACIAQRVRRRGNGSALQDLPGRGRTWHRPNCVNLSRTRRRSTGDLERQIRRRACRRRMGRLPSHVPNCGQPDGNVASKGLFATVNDARQNEGPGIPGTDERDGRGENRSDHRKTPSIHGNGPGRQTVPAPWDKTVAAAVLSSIARRRPSGDHHTGRHAQIRPEGCRRSPQGRTPSGPEGSSRQDAPPTGCPEWE